MFLSKSDDTYVSFEWGTKHIIIWTLKVVNPWGRSKLQ